MPRARHFRDGRRHVKHGELAFQGKSAELINDEKVIAHYLGHLPGN